MYEYCVFSCGTTVLVSLLSSSTRGRKGVQDQRMYGAPVGSVAGSNVFVFSFLRYGAHWGGIDMENSGKREKHEIVLYCTLM